MGRGEVEEAREGRGGEEPVHEKRDSEWARVSAVCNMTWSP